MKFRYQVIVVMMIVGLGILVTTFTNCAGLNQGSDELEQKIVFSDEGLDCTTGRICTSFEDIECFDDYYFFEKDPGVICQKYPPQTTIVKSSSRGPASVVRPIKRMPAIYQHKKSLQEVK